MAVVYWLGTALFSAARMEPLFYPYFQSLLHAGTANELFWDLSIVRWSAHFLEYLVLCFLLARIVGLRPWLALLISVLAAAADEGHQYFIPARTCSLRDLGYDSAGAVTMFVLLTAFGGRAPAAARRALAGADDGERASA